MSKAHVVVGLGAAGMTVGAVAVVWGLVRALGVLSLDGVGSIPAPVVVRTPSAQIVPLPKDLDALTRRGRNLAPGDAARLKARVAGVPGDAPARAVLMEYGMFASGGDEMAVRLQNEQIVWFAANLPASPVLRDGAAMPYPVGNGATEALVRRLMAEAVARSPRDADVLTNAADFQATGDTDIKIDLLTRAAVLRPNDPKAHDRLAFAHFLDSHRAFGSVDRDAASRSADEYLRAKALGGRVNPKYFLEACLDACRLDVAEREARRATAEKDDPDAVHDGHITLGRVALARGDVEAAKRELLASANVAGSPVLDSFGPSTELAKVLLERGERATVLAYLRATGRFWKDERQRRWTQTVADGGTPDWG